MDLGEPQGKVIWSRDGHSVTDDPRFTKVEEGLKISEVTEDDAGVYDCILQRDGLGSDARNINVAVMQDSCAGVFALIAIVSIS